MWVDDAEFIRIVVQWLSINERINIFSDQQQYRWIKNGEDEAANRIDELLCPSPVVDWKLRSHPHLIPRPQSDLLGGGQKRKVLVGSEEPVVSLYSLVINPFYFRKK